MPNRRSSGVGRRDPSLLPREHHCQLSQRTRPELRRLARVVPRPEARLHRRRLPGGTLRPSRLAGARAGTSWPRPGKTPNWFRTCPPTGDMSLTFRAELIFKDRLTCYTGFALFATKKASRATRFVDRRNARRPAARRRRAASGRRQARLSVVRRTSICTLAISCDGSNRKRHWNNTRMF